MEKVSGCTTNHCALSHCSKAEETAPKISHWWFVSTSQTVFFLMETSHRHMGDGSLHRKCFIVSVENLRCSIMERRGRGREESFVEARRRRNCKLRSAPPAANFPESTAGSFSVCGFDFTTSTTTTAPAQYDTSPLAFTLDPPEAYLQPNHPSWIQNPSTSSATTMSRPSRKRSRSPSPSLR